MLAGRAVRCKYTQKLGPTAGQSRAAVVIA